MSVEHGRLMIEVVRVERNRVLLRFSGELKVDREEIVVRGDNDKGKAQEG